MRTSERIALVLIMVVGELVASTRFAQGVSGVDIGWGTPLSSFESGERTVSGSLQMVGTALALYGGARGLSAVNGAPNLVGRNFGKLGTVVDNPNLSITGFTRHGIDQVITRGVSPQSLLATVREPVVVLQQSGRQFLYLSGECAVVLNPGGRVITTYPASMYNPNIQALLQAGSR